jgi:hypothetical protein
MQQGPTDAEIIDVVAGKRYAAEISRIPDEGAHGMAMYNAIQSRIIDEVKQELVNKREALLDEYEQAKGKNASASQASNVSARRWAFQQFMDSDEGKALEKAPGWFSAKRTPEQEAAIAEYKAMKTAYAAGANVGPILDKLKSVGLKKGGARRSRRTRRR